MEQFTTTALPPARAPRTRNTTCCSSLQQQPGDDSTEPKWVGPNAACLQSRQIFPARNEHAAPPISYIGKYWLAEIKTSPGKPHHKCQYQGEGA